MDRRDYLVGLAAASSATSLVGVGALSSTTSERSVHASVVRDADAFLALYAKDTPIASGHLDGELQFEISPSTLPEYSGKGLAPDSVYEFTGDDGVFTIQNQGTKEIVLYGRPVSDGSGVDVYVKLASQSGGERLTQGSPSHSISPTEMVDLGLVVDTSGVDGRTVPERVETATQLVARKPR